MSERISEVPMRDLKEFARGYGLGEEVERIDRMKFKWASDKASGKSSYNTSVKKGCLLKLLIDNHLLDKFKTHQWPIGWSATGERQIRRFLSIADSHENYTSSAPERISEVPMRSLKEFARGRGLGSEVESIDSMKFKWANDSASGKSSYNSSVKKGCLLKLLINNQLLDEFKTNRWPIGWSATGEEQIRRFLSVAEAHDNYIPSP